MPTPSYSHQHFESMFAGDDDPWRFRSRWYEARKRALTMACLPAARYGSVHEPGCANGELSALLAERCDHLLASDGAVRAVELARARLASQSHVTLRQAWMPEQWPDGRFDLVVLSELGYFLDAAAVDVLAARTLASLQPGGTVLACHWRWPIDGCTLTGDDVHRRLAGGLGLPLLTDVVERDLLLQVWCTDSRSVGERGGLVEAQASDGLT